MEVNFFNLEQFFHKKVIILHLEAQISLQDYGRPINFLQLKYLRVTNLM